MSRKTRKRRLKRTAEPVQVFEDRPVNWSRLRQIFGNLSHRGTRIFEGYVLSLVVVDAKNPEDAAVLSELAIVEMTKEQPPS